VLLRRFGQLYSEELGIDLRNPFEWLIASILFGNRISTSIAKRTFLAYKETGLTTPDRVNAASWEDLVRVHGRGGYVRYDESTARYMKETARRIVVELGGDISKLDRSSKCPEDLEGRLTEFKGVGPVTARIFLRELYGLWRNADPPLTEIELRAARGLGVITEEGDPLEQLKEFWENHTVAGYDLRNLRAALVRVGLKLRRGKSMREILGEGRA